MTGDTYYDLGLKALNGIIDTLNAGLEQAPAYVVDLVNRYGIYVGTSHLIYALMALIILIGSYLFWKKAYDICINKWEDDEAMTGITLILITVGIIASIVFVVQISTSIKGYVLPEVSLIQDITGAGSCSSCK